MSYMELDGESEVEYPGLAEARAKAEEAIVAFLRCVYPELEAQWMPSAWGLAVEAVGYNELGTKFRAVDMMYPNGQSISATSGVLDIARDGFLGSAAEAMDDEEDDD